jgi:hypothetical protein
MTDPVDVKPATTTPGPVVILSRRPWIPWAMIALAMLLSVALAFTLLGVVTHEKVPNELSLPVLAIAGVVALLASLAVVAVSFSLVNMADKTQPLGLPKGSVRAVIALSLVVLFAILTVYLFSSLNGWSEEIGNCLSDADSARMVSEWRGNAPISRRPIVAPDTACPRQTAPLYSVFIGRVPDQAGIDFAKQLLVLIGTLVTSVASFYFGSKAVGEARDVMAGLNVSPTLQGVQPTTLPQGGKDVSLDLLGSGLNGARQVQVSRGQEQINAIRVTSNDNRVHAKFDVPETTPIGGDAWDISVSDSHGRTSRLTKVITIVAPLPEAGQGGDGAKSAPVTGPAPAGLQTQLADTLAKLTTEKSAIAALRAVGTGTPLPLPSDSTLAEIDQWLAVAAPLTKGAPDAATVSTVLQNGLGLLDKAQNTGLPGALADVLALLSRAAGAALPAVAGIPAGPVGIALGVLSGLIGLAADQQKLGAARAALLNAPFDPGVPPALPTADTAKAAVIGTPFAGASPDQALTIMRVALQLRDGAPLPADEVAQTLLAEPTTTALMEQFGSPALRAQAIEALRADALFQQVRTMLGTSLMADVPAAGGAPAGRFNLRDLLDWLQARRGDPDVAAAIEKLVAIGEALAGLPGDKQAILARLAAALDAANLLASKGRQT